MLAVAGTPAYMSPEQAAGRRDIVGPVSDVYSLGATLYVLLTNTLPYPGQDAEKVLERVIAEGFPRPHSINPNVPPALEAICLRAMARRRTIGMRPRSLSRPISSGGSSTSRFRFTPTPGRVGRGGRRARHPALIGAVAAASILLMAVLASATLWLSTAHQREQSLRSEAESHEQIANQERDELIRERDAAAASFRLAQSNFLRTADTEEALRKALGVAEKLTQDFADVPDYLYLRVEILILLDRYADAAEAARSAAEVKSLSAANAVSAATTLAFAAGKIALDERLAVGGSHSPLAGIRRSRAERAGPLQSRSLSERTRHDPTSQDGQIVRLDPPAAGIPGDRGRVIVRSN